MSYVLWKKRRGNGKFLISMNRLEKQFVLMAGASAASLAAFFGYFFFPRSLIRPLPVGTIDPPTERSLGGFMPVSAEWGIQFYHQGLAELRDISHIIGSGVALGDFDGDGRTDIYLVNATPEPTSAHRPCLLYLNRGRGGFVAVPDAGGANPDGLNMGAACADYDNDGDLDLYVTRIGPDRLFRNDGTGHFEDVTEAAGIDTRRWGTSAAFADYDRDGDLDIFVANYVAFDQDHLPTEATRAFDRDELAAFNPYLFDGQADVLLHNEGDGTFTDVTSEAGINDEDGKGLAVAFTDLNADGWPDIYVVNDVSPNALYVNEGGGRFVERGVPAGVADPRGGMGLTVGDYDLDGYLDLFSTHWQDEANVLYRNLGPLVSGPVGVAPPAAISAPEAPGGYDLLFTDVTAGAGLSGAGIGLTGWGTVFFDADHDGDLDLYITNGYTSPGMDTSGACVPQPDRLLINESGRFVDRSAELLRDIPVSAGRGLAAADLDGDGDLDLVRMANNGSAVVLENWYARGHWLIVRPAGSMVVGCRVRVTSGGREQLRVIQAGTSFLSCEPPEAHFGLATSITAARVEVTWPDGRQRVWRNVPADQWFVAEPMP